MNTPRINIEQWTALLNEGPCPERIYFVSKPFDDEYLIKIGFTSDLGTRFAQLRERVRGVSFLASFPGTYDECVSLRELFSSEHSSRDWYLPSDRLCRFVRETRELRRFSPWLDDHRDERLLHKREAASLLGISVKRLEALHKKGVLIAYYSKKSRMKVPESSVEFVINFLGNDGIVFPKPDLPSEGIVFNG